MPIPRFTTTFKSGYTWSRAESRSWTLPGPNFQKTYRNSWNCWRRTPTTSARANASPRALGPPTPRVLTKGERSELADSEKQDDRNTAAETLKLILGSGYLLDRSASAVTDSEGNLSRSFASQIADQIGALNFNALIALWQGRRPERWTPDLYLRMGRRVLKLGQPLLAYDVLTEGLKGDPSNVEMRQQLALALARSGAAQRGNSILAKLREEGHRDEETLGILARTHKDLWAHATKKREQKRQLQLAHKFYHEAYNLSSGYYSGINAATLALLLGRVEQARRLATEVRHACMAELKTLPAESPNRYYPLATLGEACLIL